MLYFSEHLSLSLLEILVHVDFAKLPPDNSFVEVEIPDNSIKRIRSVDFIKPNWRTEEAVNQLQMFGSSWLKKQESLALQVPSAVMSQECNILVNPSHPDFKKIKIIEKKLLDFDPRLFR